MKNREKIMKNLRWFEMDDKSWGCNTFKYLIVSTVADLGVWGSQNWGSSDGSVLGVDGIG